MHTKESIHRYLLNVCVEGRVLARNYSKIPQSSAGGQGNAFMILLLPSTILSVLFEFRNKFGIYTMYKININIVNVHFYFFSLQP